MQTAKRTLVLTVVLALVLSLLGPVPVVQGSLAAPITVTTEDDEFVDPGPGTGCSLREAIQAANKQQRHLWRLPRGRRRRRQRAAGRRLHAGPAWCQQRPQRHRRPRYQQQHLHQWCGRGPHPRIAVGTGCDETGGDCQEPYEVGTALTLTAEAEPAGPASAGTATAAAPTPTAR